jgi:hypothetical protein
MWNQCFIATFLVVKENSLKLFNTKILNLANLLGPLQYQGMINMSTEKHLVQFYCLYHIKRLRIGGFLFYNIMIEFTFNLPKVWFQIVNLDKFFQKFPAHV